MGARRWVGVTVTVLLLGTGHALAQSPPPFPIPAETVEPPLADPKPGEAPQAPVLPGGIERTGATAAAQQTGPPPAPPRPATPTPGGYRPASPSPPVVAIDVGAPAVVAVGQDVEYRILVENRSRATAGVTVVSPLPQNAKFVKADPPPAAPGQELRWPLGALPAGARKEIRVTIKPTGGEVDNRAYLHVEYGRVATTKIVQPKLTVKQLGPAGEPVKGERLAFKLLVTNTGEVPATDVVVTDALQTEGFEFDDPPGADEAATDRTHRRWALGTLAPGVSRSLTCQVKAGRTGKLDTQAEVRAAAGVLASDNWSGTVREAQLKLGITGPKDCYTGTDASYTLEVDNTGTATLHNVVLSDTLPASSEVLRTTAGAEIFQNQQVQWIFRTLAPGEKRVVDVVLRRRVPGHVGHEATATADRGPSQKQEFYTDFLATAIIQPRINSVGSVDVGKTATYTVNLHNPGTGPVNGVRLVAHVPEQLAVSDTNPTSAQRDGSKVLFGPMTVAGGQTTTVTITALARQAGQGRFRIETTWDGIQSGPIVREGSTTVLGTDSVPPDSGGRTGPPAAPQPPSPGGPGAPPLPGGLPMGPASPP
jgi:uncharacterized repeat protein (TIGR01451 family)